MHGPLTSTLLLDLFRRNSSKKVKTFSYRALSPIFLLDDNTKFNVCGKMAADKNSCELWSTNHKGSLAMSGTVTLE